MDWENARFNMVEQQIRPWDVLDQTVLNLLFHVKRENFVPTAHRDLAFVDMELPLGTGARMWQPKLEARVVQELNLKRGDRVLDIGTGSGYLAALLAQLVKHVYSVEIDPTLAETARQRLKEAGCLNVSVETGDAALGWERNAPYDVIVAGGSYPVRPDALIAQLADGGRLFAVVGQLPVMTATLFTKVGNSVKEEKLFETVIEPLRHAPEAPKFQF